MLLRCLRWTLFRKIILCHPLLKCMNFSKMLLKKLIYEMCKARVVVPYLLTSPSIKWQNFNSFAHIYFISMELLFCCYICIIKLLIKVTHPQIKEINFRGFDETGVGLIASERKMYLSVNLHPAPLSSKYTRGLLVRYIYTCYGVI